MEQQNYNYNDPNVIIQQEGSISKKFFANVFSWMFVALSLSTFAAYFISQTPAFLSMLVTEKGLSTLGYIVTFAPLGLVLLMSAGLSRLSYGALVGVFILYSILTGASLSFIMLIYTSGSIISCFAAAAGIFGIMAFLGYTTNIDLSKFGPILMVGVIGLVIASLINMFIQSEQFSLFMAFIGIAVFTALTAYDVQKIKKIGLGIEETGEDVFRVETKKMAIMGALSLYLDFLNIFLFLLRIFGNRK
ncbi:Bax inhibitor-1/YccA family protein [Pedobacter flavus]|uniref:Bax inhibitor-1/YccA family protein n=1 Tax=Pedobacter flavus TaxID=3113906 RepID=A0ABU7H0C7_9SPHI|nr:Bax inhibitor-1/YccA family protein [Pedobacter sp. VNH31]MEE1884788.1 Bax inhibitor-1/YccA family protein [Pedobacter sp. VNH31]